MKLEKIINENGMIESVVLNGKKIKINGSLFIDYFTWLSGSASLNIVSINPDDRADKTKVNIEYIELGHLFEVASIEINVVNYKPQNKPREHEYKLTQRINNASIEGYSRTDCILKDSNGKTNKFKYSIENENKELYNNTLINLLFNDELVNKSLISTDAKEILIAFIDEVTSLSVNSKYRKAPKIIKSIKNEKRILENKLEEYTYRQSLHIKIYGKENVSFASEIKMLEEKIQTYDNIVSQIKPVDKTL